MATRGERRRRPRRSRTRRLMWCL
ncbi:hypothetical protein TSOC_014874 [Tetrabaena socialis]|uniref:Uncharacterized protein n=1 Tax=Tetrabaena socialis TaxID=47790 RepID=A0A2J7ZGF2_9CHLO|nr:hypothetical protein TSOC_014874 [Tetrabaena socialis]|eukprot:PNG99351.1 hypothetical protein TSOC_014874 [Tetrabaena socialis]